MTHIPPDHLDAAASLPSGEPLGAKKVESGVNPFEGAFGTSWYGWARFATGNGYREGPIRHFRFRARLDAWRLARKLARAR